MKPASVDPDIVAAAWRHARKAAANCGVEIRALYGSDVSLGQDLVREAWGPQQVPQGNLLHALSHAGNTVLAALHGDRATGVAFGFLGWSEGLHLHSHMAAVTPGRQSRGVGFALKSWQRAMCLEHGITEMRWTYDPLIARNAYFNLVKLGARVRAFYPDFYGAMDDTVNAGDHSDRFEVSWQLDADGASEALDRVDREGRPDPAPGGPGELVPIPRDFDALRRADPGQARALRLATSAQFRRLFAAGQRPEWTGHGYYFTAQAPDAARPEKHAGHTHA